MVAYGLEYGYARSWYGIVWPKYLRLVTEFALPSRIANALIGFLLAIPVHAPRIGYTLVTPTNIFLKSWTS